VLTVYKYYIYTKETLPMDIDFIIQDTFALTRPQWSLSTNLDEAGRSFAEAVAQNYKARESGKPAEPDESDDDTSSEDGVEEDELPIPEAEEVQSSGEEIEAEVCFLVSILQSELHVANNAHRRRPTVKITLLNQTPTKRRSSSHARKKSETPRQMLTLIESLQS